MTVYDLIQELRKQPPLAKVYRYCDWEVEEVNLAPRAEGQPEEPGKERPCVTLY